MDEIIHNRTLCLWREAQSSAAAEEMKTTEASLHSKAACSASLCARVAAAVAATVAVAASAPMPRRRRLVHEKGKPSTAALPWSKAWYSLYGDCLWCEVQESSPKGTWKHLCWATFGWWKKNACLLSGETKIHYIISSTVAAHLRAVTLMETQHFFSKGQYISVYFFVLKKTQNSKCGS